MQLFARDKILVYDSLVSVTKYPFTLSSVKHIQRNDNCAEKHFQKSEKFIVLNNRNLSLIYQGYWGLARYFD